MKTKRFPTLRNQSEWLQSITSLGLSGENQPSSTPRCTTAGINLNSRGVVTCIMVQLLREKNKTISRNELSESLNPSVCNMNRSWCEPWKRAALLGSQQSILVLFGKDFGKKSHSIYHSLDYPIFTSQKQCHETCLYWNKINTYQTQCCCTEQQKVQFTLREKEPHFFHVFCHWLKGQRKKGGTPRIHVTLSINSKLTQSYGVLQLLNHQPQLF